MNEEIIELINSISKNVYSGLIALNTNTVNQLNKLIKEEKEQGKKELLINEKKKAFDNFINEVTSYLKDNLTEQQMKDILVSFLNPDNELMNSYDEKYRSFEVELDTLYYILHGLCTAITDKEFLNEIFENYFKEIIDNNNHDIMIDFDKVFFQFINYSKSLLLLSYCHDKKLINEYVNKHLNQKSFITQFSNSLIFDDTLLIQYATSFFNSHKGNENLEMESWNFYNRLLVNEDIPLISRKKITNLFKLHFPKHYDYEKGHICTRLINDYDSAISTILENDFRRGYLIHVLADCKISGEDLIKLYNDERVISRLDQDYIVVNYHTDSETKYNILFHTLLTRYALNKNIMYKTILEADEDLLYGVLSHNDSLNYMLQNQEFINKFIERYFSNSHKAKTNAKILEIFKESLTSEQMNKLFQPYHMPHDVHLQYYLDDKYCYKIFNVYHPLYNPNGDKDRIKNIKEVQNLIYKLYNDNKYLFKTFNPNIINDDILKFDYRFISLISKYTDLQHSIDRKVNESNYRLLNIGEEDEWIKSIKNDSEEYARLIEAYNGKTHAVCKPIDSKISGKAFVNMLNVINNIDPDFIIQYIEDLDKITHIFHVGKDAFNDIYLMEDATQFEKFVVNVCQGLDVNTITPNRWKTLTKVFMHDLNSNVKNYYITVDINSLQDVDTYDERRNKKLDGLFVEVLNNKEIEHAINIFLNKYYDIDINTAREIIEVYGNDLDNIKNEKYIKSIKIIKRMKDILNISNFQELYNMYQSEKELSFEDTIIFKNSLTKIFGNSLSDSLTTFDSMKKLANNQFNIPSSISVYEAPSDFVMLVHSTLAYGELKLIDNNYKTSWNESDRTQNHGICCSLIANDYLGTAEIGDVLLGFNDLSENSLIKSAPYDLFTRNDDINITSAKKSKFLTPRNIINNTRHAHNEQSIERRELREELINRGIINLQPSYVIVFSDMDDKLRKKACKCAEDFGIPIVYVDKQKVVQNESNKIDKMIGELNNTQDITRQIAIFSEIYLKHENNRCGLMHDEELKTKFSTGRIEKVLDDIVNRLIEGKNNTHNYELYCNNVLKLIEILKREEDKFITCYETGSRVAFNDIDINQYIVKLYREIDNNLCNVNTSKLSFISSIAQSDDSILSQELKTIDSKEIESEISHFNETEFYNGDSKNHNLGHIERVTVLADLIGKKEIPNDVHSQYLLRLSAELHDSGRKYDEKDFGHAEEGANHAARILQDKLLNGEINDRDLHIIQFAIEYHEFNHNRGDNEDKLERLAQKYKISDEDFECTRKIAECLKDADALDRVRFHRMGATLDERRLITSSSHDYIETAKKLLQEYKNYDKNQFIIKTKEKCKEREREHRLFKESELKYKMKSKFEKIMSHWKNLTNNNSKIEGEINGVRRR